jgi:hypothetical protein
VVATDYPFLDLMGTLLVFFLFVAWLMLLFYILTDVFRRKDVGGGRKTLWVLFVIVAPFLGVFAYVIVNGHGMAERSVRQAQAQRAQLDRHVKDVAGSAGPAAEIEKAKALLDSGAITQAEFDGIKAKALS